MSDITQTVKYESVIPVGAPDTKFQVFNSEKGEYDFLADFRLIRSIDELKEYAKSCEGLRIAVDTETTGLTYQKDFIVGFSISKSAYDGVYVPIRHQIRLTTRVKEIKRDTEGNPILTKTGKNSMHTVEYYDDRDNPLNLPAKEALDILFNDIMMKSPMVLMHNSAFDLNMLRQEGYNVVKARTFDTMCLSYIYDPEARLNGLKQLAERLLGRKVQHFDEVTGGDDKFRYTDPEQSYIYACCDTANTFGIYDKLYPMVKTLLKQSPEKMIINGKPYNVLIEDNNLIRAFVDYYDHCEMLVDKNAAIEYKKLIDKETEDTITSIYSYFGIGQFSLSTGSKEFKEVMNKFKFETGHRTKKGAISFGKKGVETMKRALNNFKNNIWQIKNKIVFINSQLYWNQGANPEVKTTAFNLGKFITTYGAPYFEFKASKSETSTHLTIKNLNGKKMNRVEFFQQLAYMYKEEKRKLEILQLILRYTSLQKALNSYVNKLTESDSCRMRYRLTGTKSSRLSSGNGAKSDKRKNFYFSDLSAQTLTKPKSQWYKGEPAQPGDPRAVHGWVFTPVTNEYYMEHSHDEVIVEGFKQEANIRSCFVAPKGRLVCSMDYNSEELVAIALLSGDSVMLDGFRRKEDPHKTTAIGIWGAENYNVNVRKKAKAVNFLMSYQGGAGTLSETLEIPFKEAQDIIDKYKNTYHECVHWKEMEVIKMYNNKGLIYTRFGRPRQLQPWLDIANRMGDDGIRAYAERSVCSHHVQGFCGDICRFDMVKFYNTIVCNPVHRKYVDFLSFIHDELNTTIDEHRIEEYVRILEDIMVFPYLDPTLPISTGLELGHKLGDLYPFTWNDPKARDFLVPERSYFE